MALMVPAFGVSPLVSVALLIGLFVLVQAWGRGTSKRLALAFCVALTLAPIVETTNFYIRCSEWVWCW